MSNIQATNLFGEPVKPPKKKRVVKYRDFTGTPTLRVLSLGAGVQSSTILYMIFKGLLPKPDAVIFSDTGWEPKAVYRHVKHLRALCKQMGVPFYVVSVGNIRADALASKKGKRFASMPVFTRNKDGEVARLRRQCTREFKIAPITSKVRELLGVGYKQRVPKGQWVEQWIGISSDEIYRMKLSGIAYVHLEYPLIREHMTREQCISWCVANGFPIPPKSSCIGCPFHDDEFWLEMKTNDPEEFADACDFDRQIRSGLRGVNMLAYLHRSLMPLEEVDFAALIEEQRIKNLPVVRPGQLPMFGSFADECSGMCGV